MKNLELQLKERLLIVESDNEMVVGQYEADVNGRHIELLCKGSELTEEIAGGMAENYLAEMDSLAVYRNYAVTEKDLEEDHWAHCADNALDSFISAIEAQGYYWGENPLGEEPKDIPDLGEFTVMIRKKHQAWREAESCTFNPKKTLIFKILS